jgi:DNA-directed RNA polymerase subunit F
MIDLKEHDFVYLYVKSFKWSDLERSDDIGGHPAPGKVYRALRNKNNKTYGILVDNPPTRILLETLEASDETRNYTCSIVEITPKNIIDLQILEEDLTQINKWIESENKDIIPRLTQDQPTELIPVIAMIQGAMEKIDEDREVVNEGVEVLRHLYNLNSTHFGVIMELIEELIEVNIMEVDEVNLTSYPTANLSKGLAGMGFNVGKVYENLEYYVDGEATYNAHEARDNRFAQYLLDAMVALVKEKERRYLLELD